MLQVYGRNVHRYGKTHVSFTQYVEIVLFGESDKERVVKLDYGRKIYVSNFVISGL